MFEQLPGQKGKPILLAARPGMRLHLKMAIGFAAGTALGMLVHLLVPDAAWVKTLITYVTQPAG